MVHDKLHIMSKARLPCPETAGAAALIVAAGQGARFGGAAPKQYQPLGGASVLALAARAFVNHPLVDRVHVVIQPEHRTRYEKAVAGIALGEPIMGGATRQQSVRNGLEALAAAPPRFVIIHDAARPLVSADIITRTLAALEDSAGAIAAAPARDTLKRSEVSGSAEIIAATVPRDSLWLAQTPQAFRYADILAAHRTAAGMTLTDDAAVAERAGMAVALVESDARNFKITTQDDLALAAHVLPRRIRVGSGFDAHRFAAGDHVMLCGVSVPHGQGLAGHSDADVALHAVVDALLGAVSAGDIGAWFPADEAEWAGRDSAFFIRSAREAVAEAGGRIVHVDVTVIGERPRIAPYRAAMRRRLAGLLELEEGAVSVKATTTERMGFTGRGEGLAAQALATVETPE